MTSVAITRTATVNTDASFCPRTRAAGWACWISMNSGRFKYSGNFKRLPKTAEEAEFWALLNGAWYALQHGATHLLLQGDCRGALAKVMRPGCGHLATVRASVDRPVEVRTKWVKAHTSGSDARHWVNNWCDAEAKNHMRRQRKKISPKRKKRLPRSA